jgi:hypothetical protein
MRALPKTSDLTAEQVRDLFTYLPEEGLLRWRNPAGRWGRIPAGTVAGRVHPEGYRYVSFNGRQYRSSRLIWVYMMGVWPSETVDHRDVDPGNDKWDNLREANAAQQKWNNRRRKDNTTGFKCVVFYDDPRYRDGKCYRYQVRTNGKTEKSSARYLTAEEAYAAYCRRVPELHGEFARAA